MRRRMTIKAQWAAKLIICIDEMPVKKNQYLDAHFSQSFLNSQTMFQDANAGIRIIDDFNEIENEINILRSLRTSWSCQSFFLKIKLIFRFGKSQVGLCWFSSRKALVVYFVTPFCCIMILNSVFFVSSACLVWESSKSTAKITTTGKKIKKIKYVYCFKSQKWHR